MDLHKEYLGIRVHAFSCLAPLRHRNVGSVIAGSHDVVIMDIQADSQAFMQASGCVLHPVGDRCGVRRYQLANGPYHAPVS